MAQYPPKLSDLVSLLGLVDRGERIQMLIDIAERFREVPESIAQRPFSEDHRVPACESEAFVWAEPTGDGALKFHFAVENPQGISAKAMAVILDESLSGEAAETIAAVAGDLVYDVFGRELSMGKSMGLMGMVSMVTTSAKKASGGTAPRVEGP
ncbi:MAG: SufE family protein [Acidobacteriota bacterium]